VNIETAYQDLAAEHLGQDTYLPFEGLVLADTFQMHEDGDTDDLAVFPENNERLTKQRDLDIRVIVGNPPYSAGQDSANDNNANEKYPNLDASIRDTYAARSTATLKNSLYDSYIRAIRWATLRVKDRGVIAFVTNGGFLDSNTADGLRQTLAEEFSQIYVLNLRGNQRTAGEQSRREGGKVFDAGSRATVAITILVKNPAAPGPATLRYNDIGDYLSRKDKLRIIRETGSLEQLDLTTITPNIAGDWLNQRNDAFSSYLAIGAKDAEETTLFSAYSGGLNTSRDLWVYNFSGRALDANMRATVEFFNSQVVDYEAFCLANKITDRQSHVDDFLDLDPRKISWDRVPRADVGRGVKYAYRPDGIVVGTYRPFMKQRVYFDRKMNNTVYQLPRMFPTSRQPNYGFYYVGAGSAVPFSVLMVDDVPDRHVTGAGSGGSIFSRFTYAAVEDDGALFDAAEGEVIDGYRRVDNITGEALARFRKSYGPGITKDDVFFYVYGLLHCPDYRIRFAADLKKMLPRIPLVVNAIPFIDAGRSLSGLHLGYESAKPYPLDRLPNQDGDETAEAGDAAYQRFRVEKMRFGRPTAEQKQAGLTKDLSTIVYNDHITLRGVPEEAYRYMLGSRSAIEWVMERYQVKVDKASQIRNDPNDWSREVGDPRYILDLLARLVTVSLETMAIVDALPLLDVLPAGESG